MRFSKKLGNHDSVTVFKGMFTLALGSSAARIIGILSIPIITRIYTPADYGLLALYISITSILVSLTTLKFSTALPLPKADALAINLLALSIFILVGFLTLLSLCLFLFGEIILSWFDMSEILSLRWLIVLGVGGSAFYEILSLWATRKRKYKVIAKTQFVQSLLGNGAKIILGLLSFKAVGLITGQFLAQSTGLFRLIREFIDDFKKLIPFITKKRMMLVAGYYREFPYFRLPSQTLLQLSSNAPVLMMATLYGKEVTGQLSLAILAVSLPTGLIGQAMAKAFYAEIAVIGKRNLNRIKTLTIDVQKRLFILGLPLTVLVMILAQPIFYLVFGPEWAIAGKYTTILAPFVLLQFTSNPLMQVLNIVGSQITFLIINIIRILGLGALFFFFKGYTLSPQSFVIVLSFYLCIYYLGTTAFIFFTVHKSAAQQEQRAV
ncbi:polysaccharide biosynthesis protein [Psychrobacter piscatorii]|uniref:Polysaccharide biosynthesis protein n=2 Tax=Psychrobacter piscatorii TaxID=554343 RepID=A0A0T6DSC3_9GAMM|nr:polysaccharide biosynthesis protein [Psychrobacter piscatorii]